jgi:ribosome-interacting GTPase 1
MSPVVIIQRVIAELKKISKMYMCTNRTSLYTLKNGTKTKPNRDIVLQRQTPASDVCMRISRLDRQVTDAREKYSWARLRLQTD